MIEIQKSKDMSAPIGVVWKSISDVEHEQKFWSVLRNVKILSRKGDTVERVASIRRGPLGEAKSTQTLMIDPVKKLTNLQMTKGPMLGTRKIMLSSIGPNATRIDVAWEFDMKGVPTFALGFVKDNISEATDKALAQIAAEAEQASK